MMKRLLSVVATMMLPLLCMLLTSCGKETTIQKVEKDTGIDLSCGKIISENDTHGGFHNDGLEFVKIELEFSEQFDDSKRWSQFPTSDTVSRLLDGSYLVDSNGEALIPYIANGYYYFKDRYDITSKDYRKDVFARFSMNYTLAVYDSDNSILYYVRYDS